MEVKWTASTSANYILFNRLNLKKPQKVEARSISMICIILLLSAKKEEYDVWRALLFEKKSPLRLFFGIADKILRTFKF